MKKKIIIVALILLSAVFVFANDSTAVNVVAEAATEGFPTDVPGINDFYNTVLGLLTMVWGVVARAFKFEKVKVNEYVFVVLAGAITMGGIFVWLDIADAITAAFTILSSMGIWDILRGVNRQVNRIELVKKASK